ncbi:MAG: carbohydrate ABC transporter permease [Clostridiales bacterium]|jgi:multiple sugar transport system permease protein|nr:carbohydrate ABC transporter permease [Clostridiales bacterium]
MARRKAGAAIGRACAYLVLGAGALVMLYPLLYIILGGLFTAAEFNSAKMSLFPIPKNPTFNNFKLLIAVGADKATLRYYLNSVLRTAYTTLFSCLTALLGGYVFARLQFKRKEGLFMALLATQMIPGIISVLPMYLQLRYMNLYDTWGVYLLFGGGALNIMGTFLVRQTLEKMPVSIEEAAKVDGAGTFRILFQIVVPMLKTILIYLVITGAIGVWNDWSTPFFYTESQSLQTIPSALTRLTAFAGKEGQEINYPLIMTFSLLVTVPSVLIFFIFQKHIVQGLMSAGIKG